MVDLALTLDPQAQKSLNDLMRHYQVKSRADIISKAIALLKIVTHIENTDGELIARKGESETKIMVR